jgi:hypothetical protein
MYNCEIIQIATLPNYKAIPETLYGTASNLKNNNFISNKEKFVGT